jgi:hypothetical protein
MDLFSVTQDIISILILVGVGSMLVAGVIVIVVRPKAWGDFASLTVYHDFQPKDKQEAIEIVMEKKAGKKMEEVESGEDK